MNSGRGLAAFNADYRWLAGGSRDNVGYDDDPSFRSLEGDVVLFRQPDGQVEIGIRDYDGVGDRELFADEAAALRHLARSLFKPSSQPDGILGLPERIKARRLYKRWVEQS